MRYFCLILLLQLRTLYAAAQENLTLALPIGHTEVVTSACFTPDDKILVTTSNDHTIKVWDVTTGVLLHSLEDKDRVFQNFDRSNVFVGGAQHLAICPDGELVLIFNNSNSASLWNIVTGEKKWEFAHSKWVSNAHFSNDGKYVVTASDDSTVKVWSVETGTALYTLRDNNGLRDAVFDKDKIITAGKNYIVKTWDPARGDVHDSIITRPAKSYSRNGLSSLLVSGNGKELIIVPFSNTDSLRIWDLQAKKEKCAFSVEPRYPLPFISRDGRYLIIGGWAGNISVRNPGTGEVQYRLPETIWTASADRDSKFLAGVSFKNKTVQLFDLASGKEFYRRSVEQVPVSAVMSNNSKFIAIACYSGEILLLNRADGKLIRSFRGNTDQIRSAAFSSDGNFALTGQKDQVSIWDLKNARIVKTIHLMYPIAASVGYSADGSTIKAVSIDRLNSKWCIEEWDTKTYAHLSGIQGNCDGARMAELSPDGNKVVTVPNNGNAQLWDAHTGKLQGAYGDKKEDILFSGFSADSRFLLVTSAAANLKRWELSSGKSFELKGYTNQKLVKTSHDGRLLVTLVEDMPAKIWDIETGSVLHTLRGDNYNLTSAEFSPDDKYIATTSYDKTTKIWDVASGELLHTLEGHTDIVNLVKWSPDGKFIITGASDNTAKLWKAATGEELYSFFAVDSTDYFTQIQGGYYSCSQGAARLLHYFTKSKEIVSFAQLDIRYNRPDKVLEHIGNTDTLYISSLKLAYLKRVKKMQIDTNAYNIEYTLPEAHFENRDNINEEQASAKLSLHISGNGHGKMLTGFNLWVNECPVFGVRGIDLRRLNTTEFDTTITVELSHDKNVIETSITNINGAESYRKPLIVNYTPHTTTKEKVYFAGIGIDHFAQPGNDLNWSTKDIRDLAKALKQKFGDNCIIVDTLFNERVTIEQISAIKTKLAATTVNDKVIIAYSGHGLLDRKFDYFLSTYNVDFDNPSLNGLAYEKLEDLVDDIPPRKKLLLIDACHSGELDQEELTRIASKEAELKKEGIIFKGAQKIGYKNSSLGVKNSFELMQTMFVNVRRNTGAVVIAAAGGTQFAIEKGKLKNGIFTHCLLEELAENDINISRLCADLRTRVTDLSAGLQVPTTRSDVSSVNWKIW